MEERIVKQEKRPSTQRFGEFSTYLTDEKVWENTRVCLDSPLLERLRVWVVDLIKFIFTEVLPAGTGRKAKMSRHTDVGEIAPWRWRNRLDRSMCKPRNAKDFRQLPEATREAWNSFSLRASSRNQPCQHLDFRLLALEVWEKGFSLY